MNTIPDFLRPVAVPMGLDAVADADAATARRNQVFGFSMTCQQEDQWCWAAVTQAVERWRGAEVSQSRVASHHIAPGQGLVCSTPLPGVGGQSCGHCDGSAGCGDPHFLSKVLEGRGRLAANGATNHVPPFETIVEAIDDQRPLPVRIGWNGVSGHFICVAGYRITSSGTARVILYDPLWPGRRAGAAAVIEMDYDAFATDYDAASGNNGVPNYSYEVVR
jgi:hypothetical protein